MTELFIWCGSAQGGIRKEKRKYFKSHVTTESKYSQPDDLAMGFLHKLPVCGVKKQHSWVSLEKSRSGPHIIMSSDHVTQLRYYPGRKFSANAAQVETDPLFYISDRVDQMRWLYFEQKRDLEEANVILLTFFMKFLYYMNQ